MVIKKGAKVPGLFLSCMHDKKNPIYKKEEIIMKRWQKGAALLLAVCLMLALPLGAGAANETVEHAYALNELGLFQGMDSGFELDKRPTRLEGMTMFVRLLGGEEEALQKNYDRRAQLGRPLCGVCLGARADQGHREGTVWFHQLHHTGGVCDLCAPGAGLQRH